MLKSRSYQSAARFPMLVAVATAIAACGGAGEGATGPAAPEADAIQADVIHEVTVRFDSLRVLGSCDRNSIFETQSDGEFSFAMGVGTVTETFFHRGTSGTYAEGTYRIGSGWSPVFRRNVSKKQEFRVHFIASEKDGILGNDPSMDAENKTNTHTWSGTAWSGSRQIEIATSKPSECGVRLSYTITSTREP